MPKIYLGDGAYIQLVEGQFYLTTEDGISTTNTVVLDSDMMVRVFDYARKAGLRV